MCLLDFVCFLWLRWFIACDLLCATVWWLCLCVVMLLTNVLLTFDLPDWFISLGLCFLRVLGFWWFLSFWCFWVLLSFAYFRVSVLSGSVVLGVGIRRKFARFWLNLKFVLFGFDWICDFGFVICLVWVCESWWFPGFWLILLDFWLNLVNLGLFWIFYVILIFLWVLVLVG